MVFGTLSLGEGARGGQGSPHVKMGLKISPMQLKALGMEVGEHAV